MTAIGSTFRLFFSTSGRIPRRAFAVGWALSWTLFLLGVSLVESAAGLMATVALYPPFYWSLLALGIKRYHDVDKAGTRLGLVIIPIIGPFWALLELTFRRGTPGENRYGPEPTSWGLAYAVVENAPGTTVNTVNDVTGIHPVQVAAVALPTTIDGVQEALRRSNGPISIGGGRFSMGGQTSSVDSLHIDMRGMNRIVSINPVAKTVRVQPGVRWCDLQRVIDAHDLAVRIMQTYANFTVGGSIGVNCHGRYIGEGPLIRSVNAITLCLADGSLVEATPSDNSELFYGAIGGYGGLGVVVEIELSLADNTRVEQTHETMGIDAYYDHFRQTVRDSTEAVFHNADLYPPHYDRMRSVTWRTTDKFVTEPSRLMALKRSHAMFRYLFWVTSEMPLGKWRRQHMFEPLFYLAKRVHWRNYEAGYDVAELEPSSRARKTYVLQEYFVPIARFREFAGRMAEVFQRYDVNVINVSVRHAKADPGSLLAWAREECFAFVVYYKQETHHCARNVVATWTRELISQVVDCDGAYYLPYQPHATAEQFHAAYPRATEFFALKERVDPHNRFRNALWNKYYQAEAPPEVAGVRGETEFHAIFGNPEWADRFFLFLQNVYGLYPPDRFHWLIHEACGRHERDEAIYRDIQTHLKAITPALAPLRLALPALKKQKGVMTRQTLELVGDKKTFDGMLEIGSTGRYVSAFMKEATVRGPIYLLHEVAPTMSPVDMVERGGIKVLGQHIPMGPEYAPITSEQVPDASLDMVTCFIGLHHAPLEARDAFVKSLHRVLRPGGILILRDHDVTDEPMRCLVSLVHCVFNCGLEEPWSVDEAEFRAFESLDFWTDYLRERGFETDGRRLFQDHDPTLNGLMKFVKEGG